jgi:hypothetical protein
MQKDSISVSLSLLLILFLLVLIYTLSPQRATFATSPSVPYSEINDDLNELFSQLPLPTWKYLADIGDIGYSDIQSVTYSSDGKFLNATIWLKKDIPHNIVSDTLGYAIFIDADNNIETGYDGIDYAVLLAWDNDTKEWSRFSYQLPFEGVKKALNDKCAKTFPTNSFPRFIDLCADLRVFGSPSQYMVLFSTNNVFSPTVKLEDYSKWVRIPPPQYTISSSPNAIILRPGEQKTIDVRINSTEAIESSVTLYAQNQSTIQTTFDSSNVHVPSFGMTTPLTINVSQNALTGAYPIYILAESSFSRVPININTLENRTPNTPYISIPGESTTTGSTIIVNVQKAYGLNDAINGLKEQLYFTWKDNKEVLILIIGAFMTPFGAWIFNKSVKKSRRKKNEE